MEKKLYKCKSDKKLCGVCSGLGKFLGLDPTIIRLIWVLAILLAGSGVVLYIAAALVVPEEPIE